MIKVRYDAVTKKIGKSYPANIEIPSPYIEMTEKEHNKLRAVVLPKGKTWYLVNGKFQIKDDTGILKEKNNSKIYNQIQKLEQSQSRALREMIVNPNDYAKNKLIDIDNQIQSLRQQIL